MTMDVLGKSKAEIEVMMGSISAPIDKNNLSNSEGCDSLKSLEERMTLLSKNNGAKETFGINFNS